MSQPEEKWALRLLKKKLIEAIRTEGCSIIVLAGFLSILSPHFISEFRDRILNIHPSLIPSFCGNGFYGFKVHQTALERGVNVTGATVHLVNELTYGGRILFQKTVEEKDTDDAVTLQRRVKEEAEWIILPRAVEMLAAKAKRRIVMTISEYLDRKYPGRVIIAGNSSDGKAVLCYAIMGRSENSRNRVFAFDEDGTLKTKPYDESKVEDPSLIIYNAMKQYEDKVILTNGSQTDTIYETFENGGSIEDAVMKMTYEPDEPNWTSRINAVFNESESTYSLSIIRKEGSSPVRVIYSYPCQKGWGHCIHTYLESESDLLPPFTVDPQRIEIPSSIQELADEMWNALNEDNRISLFVQFGDEMTVLNKNNGD